jgi:hypothetical protein
MQLINYDGFHGCLPSTSINHSIKMHCSYYLSIRHRSIIMHADHIYRRMDAFLVRILRFQPFATCRSLLHVYKLDSKQYVSCGLLLRPLNATCYVAFLPSCSLLHKQNMAPDHWLPCLFQI